VGQNRHKMTASVSATFFWALFEKLALCSLLFTASEILGANQGDQIGRIFACWASLFFGQLFEKYTSRPNF
jgi:hypothetical protein